jgi:hypothetical protein
MAAVYALRAVVGIRAARQLPGRMRDLRMLWIARLRRRFLVVRRRMMVVPVMAMVAHGLT